MPDDQVQYDPSQFPMIPGRANTLAAMMPGVLPPTSPIDPNAAMQQSMLGASEQGRQTVAEQLARARAVAGTTAPAIQQAADMPMPKMGFHPDFGGGVLHDIGQAILSVLAATGPGQAVQDVVYGPKIREYQAGQTKKAEQISRLQKQQQLEEEPIPAAAGMIYHPFTASAAITRAEAEKSRAASYAESVKSAADFRNFLKAFEPQKLNEQQRHNRVEEQLTGMGIEVQRERNQVLFSLGDRRIAVDASKFDAAVNNKTQGFFDQIFTGLGLKQFRGTGAETETLDITSPTAKKAAKAAPKAVTPSKPSKGVVKWGRDAQGNPVRVSQ